MGRYWSTTRQSAQQSRCVGRVHVISFACMHMAARLAGCGASILPATAVCLVPPSRRALSCLTAAISFVLPHPSLSSSFLYPLLSATSLCPLPMPCRAPVQDVFNETRSILEPAGAVAVAGAKAFLQHYGLSDKRVVAVTSGANMNFDRLRLVSGALAARFQGINCPSPLLLLVVPKVLQVAGSRAWGAISGSLTAITCPQPAITWITHAQAEGCKQQVAPTGSSTVCKVVLRCCSSCAVTLLQSWLTWVLLRPCWQLASPTETAQLQSCWVWPLLQTARGWM